MLDDPEVDVAFKFALEKGAQTTASQFNELCEHFRLDPKFDFVASDLSGTDLTNADLRGFDLSYSDLRCSYGSNISWDNSTNFTGADLQGSSIEYEVGLAAAFEEESLQEEYDKLIRRDFFAQHDWIIDAAQDHKRLQSNTSKIAQKLFLETDDLSIRNSLALFIDDFFEHNDLYRQYLFRELSARADDTEFVLSTITTLAYVFGNKQVVGDVLAKFLYDDRYRVQEAVYSWFQNTTMARMYKDELIAFTRSSEGVSFLEKDFRRKMDKLGWGFAYVFEVIGGPNAKGFIEPLSAADINEMSIKTWRVTQRSGRNRVDDKWKKTPAKLADQISGLHRLRKNLLMLSKTENIKFKYQDGVREQYNFTNF